MRAHRKALADAARASLCVVALVSWSPPSLAQQARQQGQVAQTRTDGGAPCFASTDPTAIAAGCDIVLRAAQGSYTADQLGLALQRRGGARAALGRIDDAIADFRQMATTGYKVHEAQASIGSLEFRRERLREAETSYREALRVNPSYALALIGLGHTLIRLNRPAEAVPLFDRALATADNDASAHLGKGTALAATGDLDGAIRSFDAALRIEPRLLPALYQRAQAHHDKRDTQKALQDADSAVAVAAGEERVAALTYRGRLRNNAKDYDGAINDCRQADADAERQRLTSGVTRSAALVCVAIAQQSKGELVEAQRSYDGALRWSPRDVTALSGRGYVVLQRGLFDAALADFNSALSVDPNSQDALRFLGITYADKGDRAKADEAFARALRADPRDPWPVMIRAITAARDGERDRALADAARAVALNNPPSSDALLVRSAVHYFLENFDQARADVDAAIRSNGDNGQAYRMLARILIRNGQLDEAQRALDTAARLLPNDATVLLQRGLLALARRDFTGAERELTRSMEVNNAFAEPLVARGQALEGQGLVPAALADYRAADAKLAIDPDGRRAKALARQRIATLTGVAPSVPPGPSQDVRNPAPGNRSVGDVSLYCRLVEGTFAHSRRYTGVQFDVGCKAGN